jgi:hypothetical protein
VNRRPEKGRKVMTLEEFTKERPARITVETKEVV